MATDKNDLLPALFDGLTAGYASECHTKQGFRKLTADEMYWMQADGDLEDLQSAFSAGGMGRRKRAANQGKELSSGARMQCVAKKLELSE